MFNSKGQVCQCAAPLKATSLRLESFWVQTGLCCVLPPVASTPSKHVSFATSHDTGSCANSLSVQPCTMTCSVVKRAHRTTEHFNNETRQIQIGGHRYHFTNLPHVWLPHNVRWLGPFFVQSSTCVSLTVCLAVQFSGTYLFLWPSSSCLFPQCAI